MWMPPFKYIPKPFGIWANKKSENDIPILFGYLRLPMARPVSFSLQGKMSPQKQKSQQPTALRHSGVVD